MIATDAKNNTGVSDQPRVVGGQSTVRNDVTL